jgi:hypothetical protein
MWVLDMSDASRPGVLGKLETNIAVSDVSGFFDVVLNAAGTLAVAAVGTEGVWVIDVTTDPPLEIRVDTPGWAFGVALSADETLAYVADGIGGFRVISLIGPDSPTVVGSVNITGIPREVAVIDQIAYLAVQNSGLVVVNVSNPQAPVRIRTVGTSGFTFHVAAEGSRLVVLSNNSVNDILDVYDLSANPTAPVLTASVAVGPNATAAGVDIDGDFAYVASTGDGLKIYDLGVAQSPVLTDLVATAGEALDVVVDSNFAYVADSPATISIVALGGL